ncbi:hypothetical protein [Nonomuraea angiospora]|uniref:hypothetical protein n=1 Tax=Nonomuraea angiospora TaxID=46172 RepID=UPI0029B8913E|nr:hypothetical protein [Nonomuraea angiospora]MDX3100126.1 hypothetical protein [Nonomuraea angiospora]
MVSTRHGLPGRVEIDAARRTVDASVVARVAALPVTALAELRCTATWRSVQEIYAHLARLGITPMQRYLFCYLIASAVEEEYGISSLEKARDYLLSG